MPELWFVVGVAMGIIVTGFCAVGSFDRGAESVRRAPWRLELFARRRAVVASRTSVRAAATSRAEDAHSSTRETTTERLTLQTSTGPSPSDPRFVVFAFPRGG